MNSIPRCWQLTAAGTESHFFLRVYPLGDCDHHLVEAIHPRINVQTVLAGEGSWGERTQSGMVTEGQMDLGEVTEK